SSYIDEGAEIGKGTKIWHFSHIASGARIGENCNIGQNVFIASKAVVGNNVKIQNNVSLYDEVVLEDYVFCGPSCVFTNVFNPRSHIPRKKEFKRTVVKIGATIGANATILCGITIGKYAFIGAGSVVTKDVPDYALIYGNPGRQKGWICYCGTKLTFILKHDEEVTNCKGCGRSYIKRQNIIQPVENTQHMSFS
ncbi:MAG: N-acetyltransferase, partial [Ignavibacteriae bacterium]|nr:N-acetyltransferase [Ignavibacteriota bacterium]